MRLRHATFQAKPVTWSKKIGVSGETSCINAYPFRLSFATFTSPQTSPTVVSTQPLVGDSGWSPKIDRSVLPIVVAFDMLTEAVRLAVFVMALRRVAPFVGVGVVTDFSWTVLLVSRKANACGCTISPTMTMTTTAQRAEFKNFIESPSCFWLVKFFAPLWRSFCLFVLYHI